MVSCDKIILENLMKWHLPKLYSKFLELTLDISIFTVRWFVCIFVNTFNQEVVKVIWDHFLVEGDIVLLKVALIIFELAQDAIFRSNEYGQIILLMDTFTRTFNNPDYLNQRIGQIYINKSIISELRDSYLEIYI